MRQVCRFAFLMTPLILGVAMGPAVEPPRSSGKSLIDSLSAGQRAVLKNYLDHHSATGLVPVIEPSLSKEDSLVFIADDGPRVLAMEVWLDGDRDLRVRETYAFALNPGTPEATADGTNPAEKNRKNGGSAAPSDVRRDTEPKFRPIAQRDIYIGADGSGAEVQIPPRFWTNQAPTNPKESGARPKDRNQAGKEEPRIVARGRLTPIGNGVLLQDSYLVPPHEGKDSGNQNAPGFGKPELEARSLIRVTETPEATAISQGFARERLTELEAEREQLSKDSGNEPSKQQRLEKLDNAIGDLRKRVVTLSSAGDAVKEHEKAAPSPRGKVGSSQATATRGLGPKDVAKLSGLPDAEETVGRGKGAIDDATKDARRTQEAVGIVEKVKDESLGHISDGQASSKGVGSVTADAYTKGRDLLAEPAGAGAPLVKAYIDSQFKENAPPLDQGLRNHLLDEASKGIVNAINENTFVKAAELAGKKAGDLFDWGVENVTQPIVDAFEKTAEDGGSEADAHGGTSFNTEDLNVLDEIGKSTQNAQREATQSSSGRNYKNPNARENESPFLEIEHESAAERRQRQQNLVNDYQQRRLEEKYLDILEDEEDEHKGHGGGHGGGYKPEKTAGTKPDPGQRNKKLLQTVEHGTWDQYLVKDPGQRMPGKSRPMASPKPARPKTPQKSVRPGTSPQLGPKVTVPKRPEPTVAQYKPLLTSGRPNKAGRTISPQGSYNYGRMKGQTEEEQDRDRQAWERLHPASPPEKKGGVVEYKDCFGNRRSGVSRSGSSISRSSSQYANPVCCLAGETLVAMADGTSRTIESLLNGVGIKSLSDYTISGDIDVEVAQIIRVRRQNIVKIDLGDQTLLATPDHLFYRAGSGWLAAGKLSPGMSLQTMDPLRPAIIRSIERISGRYMVYNVKMVEAATYYVSGRQSAIPILTSSEYDPKGLPIFSGVKSNRGSAQDSNEGIASDAISDGRRPGRLR